MSKPRTPNIKAEQEDELDTREPGHEDLVEEDLEEEIPASPLQYE